MFNRLINAFGGREDSKKPDDAEAFSSVLSHAGPVGAAPATMEGHGDPHSGARLGVRVAQAGGSQNDATSAPLPDELQGSPIALVLQSTAGATVQLPPGASVAQVYLHEGNMLLVQPDGSIIVILGGADNPPDLQVGDAVISSSDLVEAFGSGAPTEPPVGPKSGGGDFSVDPGGIGDPVDLTPLLPPTALAFAVELAGPGGFENDFPTVSISIRLGEMVIVDETVGKHGPVNPGEQEGGPFGLGKVTIPGEQLFDVTVDYGGDGPGSLVFSLNVLGDGATGLETTEREAITLRQVDDATVVGETEGGVLVFQVMIDPVSGDVMLTLFESLYHYDPTDPDDLVALQSGALQAVVTATDGNGDSVSAGADLGGGVIKFEDDAPRLTGKKVFEIVDEDDIATHQSWGTSPDDGPYPDGSYTGSPFSDTGGPATVFGSLAGAVNFGQDDPGKFGFSADAADQLSALGLSSKGQPLSYQVVETPSGFVLRAFVNNGGSPGAFDDGDRLVFSLSLDESSGLFVFKLFDQMDHDPPYFGADQNFDLQDGVYGDVYAIDFGSIVTATDADYDSVTLDGKFLIKIRDDVPELTGEKLRLTVDEDDINTFYIELPGEDAGSKGNHPNDGPGDGSLTGNPPSNVAGPALVTGHLGGLVKIGADEPAKFGFVSEHAVRAQLGKLGLSSQGEKLSYDLDGDVLYGFVEQTGDGYPNFTFGDDGDRLVFKLTVTPQGKFVFELFDQMDHDPPYSGADQNFDLQDSVYGDVYAIDFGKILKVTDYDGDSITLDGKVTVKIRDDAPVQAHGKMSIGHVDEDDLDTFLLSNPNIDGSLGTDAQPGPPPNAPMATGSLAALVKVGADEPGAFSIRDFDGPQQTDYTSQGDAISLVSGGQPNTVLMVADFGGDGQRLIARFELQSDGDWKFTLLDQFDHPNPGVGEMGPAVEDALALDFSSLIKFTDFDGDSIILRDGSVKVIVKDDVPVQKPGMSVGHVDEDDLDTFLLSNPNIDGSLGTDAQPGPPPNAPMATGSLAALVKVGADEPGAFSIRDFDGPQQTDYASQGDAISLVSGGQPNTVLMVADFGGDGQRLIARFELQSDGDWKFTLFDQFDHPNPGPGEAGAPVQDVLALDFSSLIKFTDFDGDSIILRDGSVKVIVKDDVPIARSDMDDGDETIEIVDDVEGPIQVATGNVISGDGTTGGPGGPGADSVGADEPGVVTKIYTLDMENSVEPPADGFSDWLQLENGRVRFQANGDYQYEAQDGVVEIDLTDPSCVYAYGFAPVDAQLYLNLDGSLKIGSLASDATLTVRAAEGLGVQSPGEGGAARDLELGYRHDPAGPVDAPATEAMVFDLKGVFKAVEVDLTVHYNPTFGEDEVGHWQAFDAAGQLVGSGAFFGSPSGELTIEISPGAGFQYLVFTASQNLDAVGDSGGDNSDYSIKAISGVPLQSHDGDIQDQVKYRLTDYDGDSDYAILTFKDGAPPEITIPNPDDPDGPSLDKLSLTVEESALADGSDPSSPVDCGNLTVAAGSDAVVSIAFGALSGIVVTDANGAEVDVLWGAGPAGELIGRINGEPAIIVELIGPDTVAANSSATVKVQATLTDAFPHASPDQPDADQIMITGLQVMVTDEDGDMAMADVMVTVVDDQPDALDDMDCVVEGGGMTEGNVITGVDPDAAPNGLAADTVGADQPGLVTQVEHGGATYVVDPVSGASFTTELGGVFEIYSDGSYKYTAPDCALHKSVTLDVAYHGEDAGYDNTMGYAVLDEAGNPSFGQIMFASSDANPGGGPTFSATLDGVSESQIVFFLIPNGADLNAGLADGDAIGFSQVGGDWVVTKDGAELSGQGAPAFFFRPLGDATTLNPDSIEHAAELSPNFGWEDLVGGGDLDFNDFLFDFTLTHELLDVLNEEFVYTLEDADGDTDKATLTIGVKDTEPQAIDDVACVVEGGESATGNVVWEGAGQDILAADGVHSIIRLTHGDSVYELSMDGTTVTNDGSPLSGGDSFAGGVLTIETELGGALEITLISGAPTEIGAYTYTPPPSVPHIELQAGIPIGDPAKGLGVSLPDFLSLFSDNGVTLTALDVDGNETDFGLKAVNPDTGDATDNYAGIGVNGPNARDQETDFVEGGQKSETIVAVFSAPLTGGYVGLAALFDGANPASKFDQPYTEKALIKVFADADGATLLTTIEVSGSVSGLVTAEIDTGGAAFERIEISALQDSPGQNAGGDESDFLLQFIHGAHLDKVDETFGYTIADKDWDTSSATLTVTVKDTGPDAIDDANCVVEGQVVLGDVTSNDVPSQDGNHSITKIAHGGVIYELDMSGNVSADDPSAVFSFDGTVLTIETELGGQLAINLTGPEGSLGQYAYTAPPQLDHAIDVRLTSQANLNAAEGVSFSAFNIDNSPGVLAFDGSWGMGVANASTPNPADFGNNQVPGQVNHAPGFNSAPEGGVADDPGGTEGIVVAIEGGAKSFAFEYTRAIQGEQGGEVGRWTALDAEGNVIGTGLFGNPHTVTQGTGVGSVEVTAADLGHQVAARVVFTALPYASGSAGADSSDYFLREFSAVRSHTESFDYMLADGDWDMDAATLTIEIKDDGPSAAPQYVLIDEDDLPDGLKDPALGDDAPSMVSGVLPIATGADIPVDVSLLADGAPSGYAFAVSSDGSVLTASDSGGPVFKITITDPATGAYQVELLKALDHPLQNNGGPETAFEDNLLFTIGYRVTDADGSIAESQILLTIDDDLPTIALKDVDAPMLVADETYLTPGALPNFVGAFITAEYINGATIDTLIAAPGASQSATVDGSIEFPSLPPAGAAIGNGVFGLATIDIDASAITIKLPLDRDVFGDGPVNFNSLPFNGVKLSGFGGAAPLIQSVTITDQAGFSTPISGADLIVDGDTIFVNFTGNGRLVDIDPGISGDQPSFVTLSIQFADGFGDAAMDMASFAGLFETAFGADGPGSVAYALGVADGDPASGLVDTLTDNPVFLFLEDGQVVGRHGTDAADAADNDVVFSVSVDGDGKVALLQSRAVKHDDPGDHDESDGPATLNAEHLITLTATITDSDGDAQSATAYIGGAFKFEDDGPGAPTIELSGAAPMLATYDGGLSGGNFVGPEGGGDLASEPWQAVVDFAGAFSIGNVEDFGADGPGETTISFTLEFAPGFVEGSPSGLTSGGDPIYLYQHSDVTFIGSTSNAEPALNDPSVVFIISKGGASQLQVIQTGVIDHGASDLYDGDYLDDVALLAGGALQLTAKAVTTDGDGDSAEASLSLDLGGLVKFGDDGPSLTLEAEASAMAIHDETPGAQGDTDSPGSQIAFGTTTIADLFSGVVGGDDPDVAAHPIGYARSGGAAVAVAPSYGADGPGSISYALALPSEGVDSGLETTDGQSILLYSADDLVLGRVGGAGGPVAFAIAADPATGELFTAQYLSLNHPFAGGALVAREALSFNGSTSSAVVLPHDPAYIVDEGAVQLIVTPADLIGNQGLLSLDSTNFGTGGHLTIRALGDDVYARIQTADPPGQEFELLAQNVLTVGEDANILLSFGPQGFTLFIDGVQADFDAYTGGLAGNQEPIVLGANQWASGDLTHLSLSEPFNGQIKGFAFYGEQPTPGEAAALTSTPYDETIAIDGGALLMRATVVDADGDAATATVGIGGQVKFQDDGPSVSASSVAVDEDGLAEGNMDMADGDALAVASASASGSLSFGFGADGPHSASSLVVSLDSVGSADPDTGSVALASAGSPVTATWDSSTNTLVGHTGGDPGVLSARVFTLVVDGGGAYDFTLLKQLDHPSTDDGDDTNGVEIAWEDDIVLNFKATVTDGDGDSAFAAFSVTVDDDSPTLTALEDSTVTQAGSPVVGTFDVSIGADQPGQFEVLPLNTPDGVVVVQTIDNGVITATASFGAGGATFYTLVVDPAAGTYSFELENAPSTVGTLDTVTFESFAPAPFKVFDGFTLVAPAGQNVNGSNQGAGIDDDEFGVGEVMTIQFDDPMLVANVGINEIGQGLRIHWRAVDSSTGDFEEGFADFSSDGALVVDILANDAGGDGDPATDDIPSFDTLILTGQERPDAMGGVNSQHVKIASVGGTTIVSNPDIAALDFKLKGTDADGDMVMDDFTISFDLVSPPSVGVALGTVVEDELPGGSGLDPASAPLATSVSDAISFSNGEITALSYSGGLGPADPATEAGGVITIEATSGAWRMDLAKATGVYAFTLHQPLSHPDPSQTFGDDTLSGLFSVTVEGPGGPAATGDIAIVVNDDAPVAETDMAEVSLQQQDVNAAFVLDTSGSINADEYQLMVNAVRAAGQQIFNTANAATVTLIAFASDAVSLGAFETIGAFNDAMDDIDPSQPGGARVQPGGQFTSYEDALVQTMAVDGFDPKPGYNNQIFYLSDGVPTVDGGANNFPTSATINSWNDYLDGVGGDPKINFTGIAIGDNQIVANLNGIDLDGVVSTVQATDFSGLLDTLLSVVGALPVSANVLDNDALGADGFGSIEWDEPAGGVDTDGTIVGEYGTLTVFANGDFTYVVNPAHPDVVAAGPNDPPLLDAFTYRVTDADGDVSQSTLTVKVIGLNDAPSISAPNNGDPATIQVVENSTFVTDVEASDPDANDTLTYAKSGGADQALFTLGSSSGLLSFIAPPNFENPADANGDNVYEVEVLVSDGNGGFDTQLISVAVNNQNEPPVVTGKSSGSVREDKDLSDSGVLNVDDPDAGQDFFTSASFNTGLGQFSINSSGAWSYALNNGSSTVQALDTNESIIDAFNVFTTDGTAVPIAISIDGTDEPQLLHFTTSASEVLNSAGEARTFIVTIPGDPVGDATLTISAKGDYSQIASSEFISVFLDRPGNNDIDLGDFGPGLGNVDIQQINNGNDVRWTVSIPVTEAQILAAQNGAGQIRIVLDNSTGVNVGFGDGDFYGFHLSLFYAPDAVDPIVLDLGGDGVELFSAANGVLFDLDADGTREQMGWIGQGEGLLVADLDGSGAIENGTEVFSPYFGYGGFVDALAALARYDSNADGVVSADDEAFADILVWSDRNADGLSQADELSGLVEQGIVSIDLDATPLDGSINGQQLLAGGEATLADGGSLAYVAVAFESLGASDLFADLGDDGQTVSQDIEFADGGDGPGADAPQSPGELGSDAPLVVTVVTVADDAGASQALIA